MLKKKGVVKSNSKFVTWLFTVFMVVYIIWILVVQEPFEWLRYLYFFLIAAASTNIYEILRLKGFAQSTSRGTFMALSLMIFGAGTTHLLANVHSRSLYALVIAIILYGSTMWLETLKTKDSDPKK